MFIRKKKNKSGSISVSIIDKSSGKYKLVKTIGSSLEQEQIELMVMKAKQYLENQTQQQPLFYSQNELC